MAKSCVLGVTGKIGSGKHAAVGFLRESGFVVIDVDKMAHGLYERGQVLWDDLVEFFGAEILRDNGEIDRGRLAKIVFGDSEKLLQLNRMVHPFLEEKIKDEIMKYTQAGVRKIVIVAALLELLNLGDLLDRVILLSRPLEMRVESLKKNRGMTELEILDRDKFQKEPDEFDDLIENDGDLAELKEKIIKVLG